MTKFENSWGIHPYGYPNYSQIQPFYTYPPIKMEQSVPKRRHIKFRRRGITQKKIYILILSSHLRLVLPSGLFRSAFPTKTLYTPLLSPIRATCPAHLILFSLITQIIYSCVSIKDDQDHEHSAGKDLEGNSRDQFNHLNPELNPICYLLALLGAHNFLHVSRIRVKLLTFRLLMSYIYGAPILDVSRSHTTTQHSR